jgi:hypothetical protein
MHLPASGAWILHALLSTSGSLRNLALAGKEGHGKGTPLRPLLQIGCSDKLVATLISTLISRRGS